MRSLGSAALVLAAVGLLAASAAPARPATAPQLRCKYGSKYVIKVIHGHKRRVKVCKPKPKPPSPKPQADLELTIDATLEQVTAGNHVVYAIVVENQGPETATDVAISADIPPGEAEFYGYGGSDEPASCGLTSSGQEPSHIECHFGELASEGNADTLGQSPYAFIKVLLEPSVAGDFTASATVAASTTDPHPEDDAVSKPLRVLPGPASADLSVSLSGAPDPASVPEGFTQTVSVTNTGPSEATDVLATVLLPQGATLSDPPLFDFLSTVVTAGLCPPSPYSIGGTSIVCFDFVGSGETRTATIRLAPSIHSPATLRTDAVVSSYTRDSNLADNRASSAIGLTPFQPQHGVDLELFLDRPANLVAGKPVRVPFRLPNLGLADAHDVDVQATTEPALNSLSISIFDPSGSGFGCTSTELPVSCPIPDVPSDTRLVGTVSAPSAAAGPYTATITVTSPDLSAPLTSTVRFDVKPSPARR